MWYSRATSKLSFVLLLVSSLHNQNQLAHNFWTREFTFLSAPTTVLLTLSRSDKRKRLETASPGLERGSPTAPRILSRKPSDWGLFTWYRHSCKEWETAGGAAPILQQPVICMAGGSTERLCQEKTPAVSFKSQLPGRSWGETAQPVGYSVGRTEWSKPSSSNQQALAMVTIKAIKLFDIWSSPHGWHMEGV